MSQAARDLLFLVLFFGSYFVIYWIVARSIAQHTRAQNTLLNRCRSLYLRGAQHLSMGETMAAEKLLVRIRRIERAWKLGNSAWLRWAVTLKGIAVAVLVAILMRSFILAVQQGAQSFLHSIADDLFSPVTYILVGAPLAHALIAALVADWYDLELITDSGDRLEKMLHAGSAVAPIASKPQRHHKDFGGLSHEQILGVGRPFTKAQLRSARNRMAGQFHPDRWTSATAAERKASDEAMKRVNAAYEALSAKL